MTNPVYESMNRFLTSHFVVRVWREQASLREAIWPDNQDLEDAVFANSSNIESLITDLGGLSRIAAVEVLQGGDGVVFYPDWK